VAVAVLAELWWFEKKKEKRWKKSVALWQKQQIVWWGVAVAGCSWHHWIEEIKAVRMVPVREWQWQYWQSCGGLKIKEVNGKKVWHCGKDNR
jgi:hypothetical protein